MHFKSKYKYWLQTFVLLGCLLFLRILYVDLYLELNDKYGYTLSDYISLILKDYFSISFIFISFVLLTVVLYRAFGKSVNSFRNFYIAFGSALGIAAATAFIVCRKVLFTGELIFQADAFNYLVFSFLASFIISLIITVIIYVSIYIRFTRVAFLQERRIKEKQEYQYSQLKRQLNPHFLFNSLNILDYLVQNKENDRASDYIKKLAGIYRYMLKHEPNALVFLSEELTFVKMYSDLIKERFSEGFNFICDIPEETANSDILIVPCGLQLLVENSIKHNIVRISSPLTVRIYIEGEYICVTNNLQPKISNPESSNSLGLTILGQQYKTIVHERIIIKKAESRFTVYLPLIRDN
ncbi:MAG: histidine kinase [Bacteroidales bacterium]|jgi:hypothetical protein|nr:histidine kinase [Bacteroidales bacterium]